MLAGCGAPPWNNPYDRGDVEHKTLYSSFAERPKHLDPARSYSSNEAEIIAQIYEPPLQYHFLKRPYQLVPLAAADMPRVVYRDAAGNTLPEDADPAIIAETEYEIRIQPGIRYQPHPAFARDTQGKFLYHRLSARQIAAVGTLADFPESATRELLAEDFAFQIKRLAAPHTHSPIGDLMGLYIVGLADLRIRLEKLTQEQGHPVTAQQLREAPLEGVEVLGPHRYRIRVKGKYAQFQYWLAMPFFAPVPWEAEAFYGQPGMSERNISLDWYPVGTGPFYLAENNPNRRMVLERNPHFHGERYPAEGEPGDAEAGALDDAGQPLPLVDRVILVLEKEEIPRWNKFLQGYYDTSGISSDAFDRAIQVSDRGTELSDALKAQNIRLISGVAPSLFYMGFNMLDPVVGGYEERKRKLRQALSIAIDEEEYIAIFLNGRGIPAQGALPPGIYGYLEGPAGINPYVYDWVDGRPRRKPIEYARRLLAEAGYPGGIDVKTGKPLVLYFDVTATGPEDKATLDWYRKQFAKLGVQLVVRATDYNQFQQKMLSGNAQLFQWGWNADYPDPENFFFLLYGPNGKVERQGENAANYANPEFDRLFERMRDLDNGPGRQALIDRLQEIVRRDAPWVFKFYPQNYSLVHQWYHNTTRNEMANNTLKYRRIDPELRARRQREWNQPHWAPLGLFVLGVAALGGGLALMRRHNGRNG